MYVFRQYVYGNKNGGSGSQPPLMIVFYQHYHLLSPLWNVCHLGELQLLACCPSTICHVFAIIVCDFAYVYVHKS